MSPKLFNRAVIVQNLAFPLQIFGMRCKKTCPPMNTDCRSPTPPLCGECSQPSSLSPSACPPACKLPSVAEKKTVCTFTNSPTMDNLSVPCTWYGTHEMLMSSINNRYLVAGLVILALSLYKFQRDEMTKRYWTNYQYIVDFDYDIDYKNLTPSVEYSLEDVRNSNL